MAKESIEVNWPRRAVVTAGMPYGNKSLHFGHVGGVFVPADVFSRFLRDRIGADNVRFVSGTDCFGSPIEEGYRKEVEAGTLEGSIVDYVTRNHDRQKATLDAYDIKLDIYEGSGIGHCGEVHQQVMDAFIKKLYDNGHLHLESTNQFYDTEVGMFLNGRQVQGHCPRTGLQEREGLRRRMRFGPSIRARGSDQSHFQGVEHRSRDAQGCQLVLRPSRDGACRARLR